MDFASLINYVTVIAAGATTVAVQILKSRFIPVRFQNHPVPTTIIVSLIATIVALSTQHFNFVWADWTQFVSTFVTILLVSAMVYNHVLANWAAVKQTEAPKDTSYEH